MVSTSNDVPLARFRLIERQKLLANICILR